MVKKLIERFPLCFSQAQQLLLIWLENWPQEQTNINLICRSSESLQGENNEFHTFFIMSTGLLAVRLPFERDLHTNTCNYSARKEFYRLICWRQLTDTRNLWQCLMCHVPSPSQSVLRNLVWNVTAVTWFIEGARGVRVWRASSPSQPNEFTLKHLRRRSRAQRPKDVRGAWSDTSGWSPAVLYLKISWILENLTHTHMAPGYKPGKYILGSNRLNR